MGRRVFLAFLLLFLIAGTFFFALAWRAEIAAVEPPARASFDSALIARGAALAALGDCVTCHTAPGGKSYAGGYPLHTPFGTIHGTNITPDPDSGIGGWPHAAFVRAMREGVDREGRHLYPAFPYDHFRMLNDEELQALYAFLMTREPVRAATPPNDVMFPFNMRMLIAGWKMLYLDREGFQRDAAQSAEWNRGAYLTQGLAHCGACHTPRNFLGAERKREYLAGGDAEGWRAPALNNTSRAPVPWTADALFRYLRYGAADTSAVAAGPMAPVVHNLAAAAEPDVRAIATYIASLIGPADPERQQRAAQALAHARTGAGAADFEAQKGEARTGADAAVQAGGVIYGATCALCHGAAQRGPGAPSSDALHLALATSIALPAPGNLIRIILQGMAPPDGDPGFFMPGFAAELTDEQIAAVVTYLRAAYTDRPAWPNVEREVRRTRQRLAEGK